ncbi:MAG: type II toxin-antitoxin system VapC family toxin [Aeromicrobium sp.]|nr:type II toxin-antitoxin system VapC family toxin [Burkholderiales bacterium]
MRYLLDTNICIYFANGRHQQISKRMAEIPAGDLAISVITYGELLYGAAKSARAAHNRAVVAALVTDFVALLPMPLGAAQKYGDAKAQLRAKGQLISDNDLWIAAHALAEGLILVTNNVSEFKRIKGLKVENWAK